MFASKSSVKTGKLMLRTSTLIMRGMIDKSRMKLFQSYQRTRRAIAGVFLALVFLFACVAFASVEQAAAQSWTQLNPTADPTSGSPSLRIFNTTVYNRVSKRLIVFAGAGAGGYGVLNDVWVLTNADGTGGTPTWIKLEPTGGLPGARIMHVAVYDEVNNRMIVHGGFSMPGYCEGILSDVWVLSNADGTGGTPTWTSLSPLGTAPARRLHGAAYDAVNNRLIINGGVPSGCGAGLNDTWVLSNANGLGGTPAWAQLVPSTPSDFPSDTSGGNTGYDPATNSLMRFVQFTGSVSTWVLSNANGLGGVPTWSHLAVSQEPAAFTWVSGGGVYDHTSNMFAFVGGVPGASSEAWTLANANGSGTAQWTQLNPTGTLPDARVYSSAVYAPATNRLTLYGGSKDSWNGTNEVWVLSDVFGPGDVPNSTVANAGPDQAVNEGVDVALDGTGSSDPEDDAITYYWTQTGGPTVALGNRTSPTPTFRSPFVTGTQTLTFELAVTDALGNTDSDFVDISVISTNDPPVADAGPDGTVKEGAARMLDGSASWDNNGQTVYYQWGQVSGPEVTLNNDTTATPTFVAPGGTAGQSVTFALVVTDGYEPSDADTVTIAIVENSPPVADAGVDQTKDEGSAVSLDGTASSDPDIGDTIGYSWLQTDGPAVTLANSTTAAPSFTAPAVSSPTAFTFELMVTDDDPITPKSDTDSVVINVRDSNAPPSCNLAVASAPKLWPPDHKMEAVAINGVADADSEYNTVTITIGGITQDEPINGTGDGDSSPDAIIVNAESVMIRRERAGDKDGRVYVVNFSASDGFEPCTGTVRVTVPHSRNGTDAVDSGQSFNSTQP